jgi:hypothetical protein
MIKRQEQIDAIIDKCRNKAYKKNKNCFATNCNNKAINSHIIWKKGIIQELAPNSHLYKIDTKGLNSRNKDLKFRRTGLNKILSFPGFCNKHDNNIFKEIEKDNTDYTKLRSQILVTLRGILAEIRYKEENIDWFNCLLNENIFTSEKQILFFQSQVHMTGHGINDLKFYLDELNKEYYESKGRFIFHTCVISKVPVVASGIFQVDSFEKMHRDNLTYKNWKETPLNNIIVTLFPFHEESILIIGYHVNCFKENIGVIDFLKNSNNDEKMKFVSDILIERIETWACSEEFYNDEIKKNEKAILEEFMLEPASFSTSPRNKLTNIFQNLKKIEY